MNLQFRLYDKQEKRNLSYEEESERGINFDGCELFRLLEYGSKIYKGMNERYEIQVNTQIPDIYGNPIYEGHIVEQRAVLVGDNSETITGVVKMLEGAWQIVDEVNQRSAMLWSEHRENRIVEVFEGEDIFKWIEEDVIDVLDEVPI